MIRGRHVRRLGSNEQAVAGIGESHKNGKVIDTNRPSNSLQSYHCLLCESSTRGCLALAVWLQAGGGRYSPGAFSGAGGLKTVWSGMAAGASLPVCPVFFLLPVALAGLAPPPVGFSPASGPCAHPLGASGTCHGLPEDKPTARRRRGRRGARAQVSTHRHVFAVPDLVFQRGEGAPAADAQRPEPGRYLLRRAWHAGPRCALHGRGRGLRGRGGNCRKNYAQPRARAAPGRHRAGADLPPLLCSPVVPAGRGNLGLISENLSRGDPGFWRSADSSICTSGATDARGGAGRRAFACGSRPEDGSRQDEPVGGALLQPWDENAPPSRDENAPPTRADVQMLESADRQNPGLHATSFRKSALGLRHELERSRRAMEDIEDLQFMRGLAERAWAEPAAPKTLSSTTRSVTPTRRARPSKEVYAKQSTVSRRDRAELGGLVPGMHTVFVKTQGCAHNVSDGEYMAGLLASYGYEITEEWSDAVDIFLFNSCTVKGPSQDSFLNMVAKAKQSGAPVVVAGCVPQGEPGRDDFEGVSIIGTQQIHRVVEVVEEAVNGNTVKLLGQGARPALELPKIRRNALVEIVPISMGCLNRCTYCKTKHARGDLVSYPLQSLVSRVETVVQEGVREVWLSSEDTGAYGKDIGVPLPQLLDAIVAAIPDGVMLRIGMTNPPHILEHMQQVARVLNHPRVFKFLHIPVQCGSNKVLEDMKREYTRQDFEGLVDYLLVTVPGITIATDVICGFPTETEEDFQETMEMLDKYKFPVVNIAQFYPRPGTVAAKLKKLQGHVIKDRSRRVTTLFHSYATWEPLVGTEQVVCVIEYGKDEKYIVGHTLGYTQVLLPRDASLLGRQVVARILAAEKWCVKGEVVRVIEHETPLPQVSISRPNILPSPKELEASTLTVVSETHHVPSRPGGTVEEDYGESEHEVGGAPPAADVPPSSSSQLLRRRGVATRAAPPGAAGDETRRMASARNEAKRWFAVLLPMVTALCFFTPELACVGALVAVYVGRSSSSSTRHVGKTRLPAPKEILRVPAPLAKNTTAAPSREPAPEDKVLELGEGERRTWEATRTTWVQEEGATACCGGAGAGACCGGAASGEQSTAQLGCCNSPDSWCAGGGCATGDATHAGKQSMPANHPEWRNGQLT
jgi:threonylcarbamoyladenosine tRNA methylthiotransferase CDKAL1